MVRFRIHVVRPVCHSELDSESTSFIVAIFNLLYTIIMKNEIKKEEIETDTEMLARIMLNGFDEIKRTMATKEEMNAGFAEVTTRLDKIDERFDVIENIKLHGLETRLEHQEDKMLQAQVFLKTKFA